MPPLSPLNTGQTLPKTERLHHQKLIESLFKQGKQEFLFPIKLWYTSKPEADNALPQILVSVSKKHFKRAVDRNLLKRRLREAYRRNKHLLLNTYQQTAIAQIAFVYIAKEKLSYQEIEAKLKRLLARLSV